MFISVMSQLTVQLSNGTVKFHKMCTFIKSIFPKITPRYVRSKMIVHAFMSELDQLDYWYQRKKEEIQMKLYVQSQWRVVGIVPSREGDIQNFE